MLKVELFEPQTGTDLTVVNAARVSFDKQSEWELRVEGHVVDGPYYEEKTLKEADKRLIQFLARGMTTADFEEFVENLTDVACEYGYYREDKPKLIEMLQEWRRAPTHFTPFAHPHVSFRCKAPIFIARQLEKHQVGFTWSEVSRRYVDSEPEFYVPEVWRKRAENVKQGSSDEAVEISTDVDGVTMLCRNVYNILLRDGVCPEQARMVLPQSMMTEWIWTGSLYGWANVYNQRKPGSHAQRDIWPFAQSLADHMARLFPVSWEALTA